ncbi:MAG: DUF2065 domain-containing protein [Gammaproteobacteria bacterium]|nr:DUF2065 domain-containing protein [Gammaproteobacteria bacterium]MDJ0890863.1 DUF2065 domain-containing protein [Gammaproteobacteria bacterium]
MWSDLLAAIALVLVIEGIIPFINPSSLRRALIMIAQMNDNTLRFTGLTSMILGILLLNLIR